MAASSFRSLCVRAQGGEKKGRTRNTVCVCVCGGGAFAFIRLEFKKTKMTVGKAGSPFEKPAVVAGVRPIYKANISHNFTKGKLGRFI